MKITIASRVLKPESIEVGKRYLLDDGENGTNYIHSFVIEITYVSEGEFEDETGYGSSVRELIEDYRACKVPDNTPLGEFKGYVHV